MKENKPIKNGKSLKVRIGKQNTSTQALTSSKAFSSGITQPHNAKKEALGPNTDR